MKKVLMILGLIGLGFVGCGEEKTINWQMGAYTQGGSNLVLKNYCHFKESKGFASSLMFLEVKDGKASYLDEKKVTELYKDSPNDFKQAFPNLVKSTIMTDWKDDPSFCAGIGFLLNMAGQKMQGVNVEREK